MKVFLSVLFCAVMFSSSASAAIFSYITKSTGTSDNATYYFEIARWDDYPPTTPNECPYKYPNKCYITINHKHTKSGRPGASTYPAVEVTRLSTMNDVKRAFTRVHRIPFPGETKHFGEQLEPTQECVGLFFQPTEGKTTGQNGSEGEMLRGSLCGIAPPPVGACKIVNTTPIINFGRISEGELAGKKADVTINVTCNLAMDVMVIATGKSGMGSRENLRSDGSLYANLTLGDNNTPSENGFKLYVPKDGINNVKLYATLGTNGRVKPGPFNGSAALILTVP
ncbi:adhesin [Providencia rettgeri]|uniref:MrpH family fimbial adhesin n=1 Tax=Providencia rettgeri TaxID=587 RepID=UPI0034E0D11C